MCTSLRGAQKVYSMSVKNSFVLDKRLELIDKI